MEIMVVYKHNKEFFKKKQKTPQILSTTKNSDHQKIREKNSQKINTPKNGWKKKWVAGVPRKSAKIGHDPTTWTWTPP